MEEKKAKLRENTEKHEYNITAYIWNILWFGRSFFFSPWVFKSVLFADQSAFLFHHTNTSSCIIQDGTRAVKLCDCSKWGFVYSLNPLDKWFASEICGLDPAEWVLWPLSRSTQVAVLLLSVWLSIDILDNGTVDVYVIMGRFKERGFFERAVSGFCLKRIVWSEVCQLES